MLSAADLTELYDCSQIEEGHGSITLTEHQRDNKEALETVTLSMAGDVVKIGPSFFDKQKDVYRKHTELRNYRKICDGALLYRNGEKENYLIVVEMKSGFNDVKKACAQISSSYVKLKTHLLNFVAYDAAAYRELGLVFSYPPHPEDYNDAANNGMVMEYKRYMVKQKPADPMEDYLNGCKRELERRGKTRLDASRMGADGLPLRDECLYDSLPVLHQPVEGRSVSLDLDDILSRL
ncbi:MAG: hypothetical protein NC388_09455 [Clostridium sp.]|nr:hypothetical protein [Clostridium sp.]